MSLIDEMYEGREGRDDRMLFSKKELIEDLDLMCDSNREMEHQLCEARIKLQQANKKIRTLQAKINKLEDKK